MFSILFSLEKLISAPTIDIPSDQVFCRAGGILTRDLLTPSALVACTRRSPLVTGVTRN